MIRHQTRRDGRSGAAAGELAAVRGGGGGGGLGAQDQPDGGMSGGTGIGTVLGGSLGGGFPSIDGHGTGGTFR